MNDWVDFTPSEREQRRLERERRQFEDNTLQMFLATTRMRYEKAYRKKHGTQRKKGSYDFVLRLSLLARCFAEDELTLKEVIYLRDYFMKRIRLQYEGDQDTLAEAEVIEAKINESILNNLQIK